MAAIKKFEGFDNKDDIYELIDKFDKSSLFELEISMTYPTVDREVKIKMLKASGGNNYADINDGGDDGDVRNETFVKMSKAEKPAASGGGRIIKAPLIGTFYSSPSPDSEPYVKVGDKVTKDTIVCIIEAMKTMNDIESGMDGEIVEILAENASPVEFGQALFRVK